MGFDYKEVDNYESIMKYADIINLTHHRSSKHPHMSRRDRAAQFSPFKALTGFEEATRETARTTDEKPELQEDDMARLDRQLSCIQEHIEERPFMEITFFQPDRLKEGGAVKRITGRLRRVDLYNRALIMVDGTTLNMDYILSMESELFSKMDRF